MSDGFSCDGAGLLVADRKLAPRAVLLDVRAELKILCLSGCNVQIFALGRIQKTRLGLSEHGACSDADAARGRGASLLLLLLSHH